MSSPLLISEPPLQVLPTLASEIGLNEAIVLQQLHYWALRTDDPEGWIYNTAEKWQAQFPFWSVDTIKRAWKSLVDRGLVETAQRSGNDRTKSYRIVYNKVPTGQFASLENASLQRGNLHRCIGSTETTQRTPQPPGGGGEGKSRKVNRKPVTEAELGLATEVVTAFNEAAGTSLSVDANLTPVVGRIREHPDFSIDHHRAVIAAAFADPWWEGPPGIEVVYGNARQFEKSIERAKRGGGRKVDPLGDEALQRLSEREAA